MHAYWKRDHQERVKKGISCRLLYDQNVTDAILADRNSYSGCDARRMPIPVKTPSWILVYKDTAVIGLPLGENPLAFEIINKDVAQSFLNYFEWLWKQTKPFNKVNTSKKQ